MRLDNDHKLNKEPRKEVFDFFFIIFLTCYGMTIAIQLSFLGSFDSSLQELGYRALGLGVISLMGISFTAFLVSMKKITISNLPKLTTPFGIIQDIFFLDEDFRKDYLVIFPIALLVQVTGTYILGAVVGFELGVPLTWDINAFVLVVNAGVGEELFFTLFLTGALLNLDSKHRFTFLILILNVVIFLLAHGIVYSDNLSALIHVAFLRVLYFGLYYKTRRPSIPILLHCVNNLIAMKTLLFF